MNAPSDPWPAEEGESINVEERIRDLLLEGEIYEAQSLFKQAGHLLPPDSTLRRILAPPRVTRSNEKGVDRSAEFNWLKTHASAHQGKWVANNAIVSGNR